MVWNIILNFLNVGNHMSKGQVVFSFWFLIFSDIKIFNETYQNIYYVESNVGQAKLCDDGYERREVNVITSLVNHMMP